MKKSIFSLFLLPFLSFSNPSYSMTVDVDDSSFVEFVDLEWLRWDITNGLSIDEAVDMYSDQGWRLASNTDVTKLVNTHISVNGISRPNPPLNVSDDEDESFSSLDYSTHAGFGIFTDDLGLTTEFEVTDPYSIVLGREFIHSTALFGSDNDGDGLYNLIDFFIEQDPIVGSLSLLSISSDLFSRTEAVAFEEQFARGETYIRSSGVALVRDIDVTPVPVPSSLVLFSSGLMMLGIWRRRKQS